MRCFQGINGGFALSRLKKHLTFDPCKQVVIVVS